MKKYLTLIYITVSVMSFAQFQDNVFEQDKSDANSMVKNNANDTTTPEVENQSLGSNVPGEHEEAPGNPGEPVPIDGAVPFLLFAGIALIVYCQKKNKKINI